MTTGNGTFRSIINNDEALYGFSTNSTFITADFRGLGLPTTSYNIFTNLMDIISIGQANCLKTQGGLCVLPQSCENYPALWSYSFRVQFANTTEYLIVPLATFAANQNLMGKNVTECVVYVENLNESLTNSVQIVLGNMFYQSFVYHQQFVGQTSTTITLGVNLNALSGTYISNATLLPLFEDPFTITPQYM